MGRREAVAVILFSLAAGPIGCSGGGGESVVRDGRAPSEADGMAPGEARRLVALVDRRIARALLVERARQDQRGAAVRLRQVLEDAARRAAPGPDDGAMKTVLSDRLASLAGRVDELEEADGAAIDELRADVEATASGLSGGYDGTLDQPPSGASGGGAADLAPPGDPAGAPALVSDVAHHLDRALELLDRIEEARAALSGIASGSPPESGTYAWEDPVYDEGSYDDWIYGDDTYGAGDVSYRTEPPADTASGAATGAALGDASGQVVGRARDVAPAAVVEHRSITGLRVEIGPLRRTAGGTVTLDVAVVNGTDSTLNLNTGHLFGGSGIGYGWGLSSAGLIDPADGTRFSTLQDSDGNCICSVGGYSDRGLTPGERRRLWARFGALPPGLRTVSVGLPGGFPLVDGMAVPD